MIEPKKINGILFYITKEVPCKNSYRKLELYLRKMNHIEVDSFLYLFLKGWIFTAESYCIFRCMLVNFVISDAMRNSEYGVSEFQLWMRKSLFSRNMVFMIDRD